MFLLIEDNKGQKKPQKWVNDDHGKMWVPEGDLVRTPDLDQFTVQVKMFTVPQHDLSTEGRRCQWWPDRLTLCHRQRQSRRVEQQTNKRNTVNEQHALLLSYGSEWFSPCPQERRRRRRGSLYIGSECSLDVAEGHSLPPVRRKTFVITETLRRRSYLLYMYGFSKYLSIHLVLTKFRNVRYFQGPP